MWQLRHVACFSLRHVACLSLRNVASEARECTQYGVTRSTSEAWVLTRTDRRRMTLGSPDGSWYRDRDRNLLRLAVVAAMILIPLAEVNGSRPGPSEGESSSESSMSASAAVSGKVKDSQTTGGGREAGAVRGRCVPDDLKEARDGDNQGTLSVHFYEAEGLLTSREEVGVKDEGRCDGTLTIWGSVDGQLKFLSSSGIMCGSASLCWKQASASAIEILLARLPGYLAVSVNVSCAGVVNEHVGTAYIRASSVMQRGGADSWYTLCSDGQASEWKDARVLLHLGFVELHADASAVRSARGLQEMNKWDPPISMSPFPSREGNQVTLFQDAIVPSNFSPKIVLENGTMYQQHSLFEQICVSVLNAKHFIYIVGWDFLSSLVLVRGDRGDPRCRGVSIGQLLTQRAQAGVKVLLMLWDNEFNFKNKLFDRIGSEIAPDTHSKPSCAWLCQRNVTCITAKRRDTDVMHIPDAFTHHQKVIVLDAPGRTEARVVVGYIGGYDLTIGRYDTPYHPLFFMPKDDVYQPSWNGNSEPRLPWHDVHSKVVGPSVWDMVANFEQRWKAIDPGHDCLLPTAGKGPQAVLFDFQKHSQLFESKQEVALPKDDPEAWNVHVIRTIDSASVAGFPSRLQREDPIPVVKEGLYIGPNSSYEKSIYDIYMGAIQRAEDFLYIENQYFIGGSQYWLENRDVGAVEKIPSQIAHKIVTKIERRENFVVYVLIPMWPAGVPSGRAVQEILRWQYDTMSMMYSAVASAIHSQGLAGAKPTDYLSFFALVNRQKLPEGFKLSEPSSDLNKKAQENRRFPIYIHSKLMILDDEYIIIGSANINQRSMDGLRDTEADIGAYQPYYAYPSRRGQIHGFRMSLWAEHMGGVEEVFRHPSTPECLKRVQEIARANWQQYTADQVTNMQSHIVPYPISVTEDGKVTHLDGFANFPDTDADVLGHKSFVLPDVLTT
ncbi:hypothetical protein CBR_g40954 [Chara braunii]|uniref:phospholipase D n=1 Tax=Chara braunii TaxID=69332 RepID=A0A388LUY9_CHABU|nr:hypothetical protein CBR_g40954 [Chara braunii]|eukprot:GBG86053.1 hypothetical protein CBR_g40954 [Chara braunii]